MLLCRSRQEVFTRPVHSQSSQAFQRRHVEFAVEHAIKCAVGGADMLAHLRHINLALCIVWVDDCPGRSEHASIVTRNNIVLPYQ